MWALVRAAALSGVLGSIAAAGLGLAALPADAARAASMITPRMLVETTDFSDLALSPDGTKVAFRQEAASIARNAYDSVWFVAALDDETAPARIAEGGPAPRLGGVALGDPPQWSADSQWLYYRAQVDGEVQVWRASLRSGSVEAVTHDEANVQRFALSADQRRLIYEVGATRRDIERAEQDEYDRGILFDGTLNGSQNLFRGLPVDGRLTSHRGELQTPLLADQPRRRLSLDLSSLRPTALEAVDLAVLGEGAGPRRPPAGAPTAQLRSSIGALAVLISDGATPSLIVRGPDGAAERVCQPCKGRVIDAIAWRGPDELILTIRDRQKGYAQSLYGWRPGQAELRLIVASDGLIGGDRSGRRSCAVGARRALCVIAGAATPPRLERIDLTRATRTVVADPNHALDVAGRASARFRLLNWTDAAGRDFTGQLLLPRDPSPARSMPLFITYYDCPGYLRGGTGDEWPLLALAAGGVAALCINKAPLSSSASEDYDVALGAVRTIVERLVVTDHVDPRRVGMGGLSFGAEVTTWVAGKSELLAAASVANPAGASPAWYWARAQMPGWTAVAKKRWGLGAPDETPDQWRKLSPVHFAEAIRAPLLMQMPEGEYRSSLELYGRLRRAGAPVELWVYPNETHQKFQPRHKLAAYERNLDWFCFWLGDRIDPDPLKATQYARWAALKDLRDRRAAPAP